VPLAHPRQHPGSEFHHRQHHGFEPRSPLLDLRVQRGARRRPAGIGNENIDAAQSIMGGAVDISKEGHPFQAFSAAKRELDALSGVTGWRLHDLRRTCVSGMAALGVAPHVADKILNHQSGTISGVAAVYQRHQFLAERREAIEKWGAHVAQILSSVLTEHRAGLSRVA
jgi:integrase